MLVQDLAAPSSACEKLKDEFSLVMRSYRKGQLFKFKIHWKIDCFSFQQHLTNSFNSPIVQLPAEASSEVDGEWYLVLTPTVKSKREHEDRERDFVSLHIRRDSNKQVEVPTRFFLRILDEKEGISYHRDCAKPVIFSGKGSGSVMWGWDRFVAHEELFPTEGRKGLLIASSPDPRSAKDTLHIQAEVHCFIGCNTYELCSEPIVPYLKTLEDDLRRSFEEEVLTDFTLVSSDGVEIHTHRVILASRSEVFRAMLTHDTREKRSGRAEIKDLDAATIHGMLEFMYSNTVKDMKDLAEKLLVATNKYNVKGLKQSCESYLADTINERNAARLAQLAEDHDAENLKRELCSFLATHAKSSAVHCNGENYQAFYSLIPNDMINSPRTVFFKRESKLDKNTFRV